MGIAEWGDFLFLPDLQDFFANFTTQPIPSDTAPEFISIDGGQTAQQAALKGGTETVQDRKKQMEKRRFEMKTCPGERTERAEVSEKKKHFYVIFQTFSRFCSWF